MINWGPRSCQTPTETPLLHSIGCFQLWRKIWRNPRCGPFGWTSTNTRKSWDSWITLLLCELFCVITSLALFNHGSHQPFRLTLLRGLMGMIILIIRVSGVIQLSITLTLRKPHDYALPDHWAEVLRASNFSSCKGRTKKSPSPRNFSLCSSHLWFMALIFCSRQLRDRTVGMRLIWKT